MAERPPKDITPQRFFEEWLPALFASAYGGSKRAATDLRIRIHLEGEGGGAWDLEVRSNTLTTTAAAGGPAQITVRQTVADWRAIAVGDEGAAVSLTPAEASPLDMLFVDPASRQVLSQVKGTVRFEVSGYAGRTWQLTTTFGEQPEPPQPNATISVDAETYARLLARQMQPPEAYFQGKVKIAGDVALAMQLAMSMLPRFQR